MVFFLPYNGEDPGEIVNKPYLIYNSAGSLYEGDEDMAGLSLREI